MTPQCTRIAVVALCAAALCAAAGAGEDPLAELQKNFGPPVMRVAKPKAPPAVDGKLDDAAWKDAQPVSLGFLAGGWETPSQKTAARVLADDKALYFAVECAESKPEQMISAGKARDGNLWDGDTVEFFLDPGHKEERHNYYHIIVNPKGELYDTYNKDAKWNANISARTGTFEGGWTVELSVPLSDLGVAAGEIPKVWGLNINRSRPQLGLIKPKGAKLSTPVMKLDDPSKYRDPEDTSWAPTMCESSHVVQCFGHALLDAGTKDVAPPRQLFEIVARCDFEDGKTEPFAEAVIKDENFRGGGKCLAPAAGKGAIQFTKGLENMDDLTLIMAVKMPSNGRFYYYGRAPDGEQCEADRHECFMTKEEAAARTFPPLDTYDTHGDKIAWMPHGRLWKAPGNWAMMTGHFAEPSIGSLISPGKDWVILRTRLAMLRRQRSQGLVEFSQNYPRGLTFHAGEPFLIDDFIIFRGKDVEAPEQVGGVEAKRDGDDVVLSWKRAKDNTLTAYYAIKAGDATLAESHLLTARVKAADAAGKPLSVVAYDLYGNGSKPSAGVDVGK